jgi:hypothetical protein
LVLAIGTTLGGMMQYPKWLFVLIILFSFTYFGCSEKPTLGDIHDDSGNLMDKSVEQISLKKQLNTFGVIDGDDGYPVPDDWSCTDSPVRCQCKGLSRLVLEYSGPATSIVLKNNKRKKMVSMIFAPKTGLLTLLPLGKKKKLPSNLVLESYDGEKLLDKTKIHTSCSKPMELDDLHGPFIVSGMEKILKCTELFGVLKGEGEFPKKKPVPDNPGLNEKEKVTAK